MLAMQPFFVAGDILTNMIGGLDSLLKDTPEVAGSSEVATVVPADKKETTPPKASQHEEKESDSEVKVETPSDEREGEHEASTWAVATGFY